EARRVAALGEKIGRQLEQAADRAEPASQDLDRAGPGQTVIEPQTVPPQERITAEDLWPASLGQRIDRLWKRLEDAWLAGQRPRVEDYLGDEPATSLLLRELIRLDVEYRHQLGEEPQAQEYQTRFPSLDPNWLARVLSTRHTEKSSRDAITASDLGQLGQYELLAKLGEGGMGQVYKA